MAKDTVGPSEDRDKAENPPDAERDSGGEPKGEIVSEWREGNDKVIERQRGAGEDVSAPSAGRPCAVPSRLEGC